MGTKFTMYAVSGRRTIGQTMRADNENAKLYFSQYYKNDYEAVKSHFDSLNKEDIIFEDGESLFEFCKIEVSRVFGTIEADRDIYLDNLKDLYACILFAQPWYTTSNPVSSSLPELPQDKEMGILNNE